MFLARACVFLSTCVHVRARVCFYDFFILFCWLRCWFYCFCFCMHADCLPSSVCACSSVCLCMCCSCVLAVWPPACLPARLPTLSLVLFVVVSLGYLVACSPAFCFVSFLFLFLRVPCNCFSSLPARLRTTCSPDFCFVLFSFCVFCLFFFRFVFLGSSRPVCPPACLPACSPAFCSGFPFTHTHTHVHVHT